MTDTKDNQSIILDQYQIERENDKAEAAKRQLSISPAGASVMQQMITAARDIDIDKLKQLQEMHYKEQEREAERLFSIDFVKMQPELPKVIRLKANTQTNSKYAALEDINKTVNPILHEHGFGTSMKILEQNNEGVKVKVMLRHRAGHIESTDVFMPLDKTGIAGTVNKTMPHAHSSSITYARRVGECLLLNISTGDDTDGNLPGDNIPEEVVEIIKQKVMQFEPEYSAKFLKYMRVESIEAIATKDTKRAFIALEQKRKAFDAEQAKLKGKDNAK